MRHHGAEGLLPEPLDIAGILAHEQRRQILHRALHHARPAAALADAGDAGVRIHLEEEPIARGASAALPFRRIHPMRRRIGLLRRKLRLHQESLDIGYAQGSVLSAADIIVQKDPSHDRRCVLRHARTRERAQDKEKCEWH